LLNYKSKRPALIKNTCRESLITKTVRSAIPLYLLLKIQGNFRDVNKKKMKKSRKLQKVNAYIAEVKRILNPSPYALRVEKSSKNNYNLIRKSKKLKNLYVNKFTKNYFEMNHYLSIWNASVKKQKMQNSADKISLAWKSHNSKRKYNFKKAVNQIKMISTHYHDDTISTLIYMMKRISREKDQKRRVNEFINLINNAQSYRFIKNMNKNREKLRNIKVLVSKHSQKYIIECKKYIAKYFIKWNTRTFYINKIEEDAKMNRNTSEKLNELSKLIGFSFKRRTFNQLNQYQIDNIVFYLLILGKRIIG